MKIKLNQIKPSPNPIRKTWDEVKLEELAHSIKEQGLIVPIKVRPTENEHYEIVYGHRRAEAARRADMFAVEVIVEGVDDINALLQQLTENIREDVEPIETAKGIYRLKKKTGWSNEKIALKSGTSRSKVSQLLLLLKEPDDVQYTITSAPGGEKPEGKISVDHVEKVREVLPDSGKRADVLRKAAKEGLTSKQTRRVAETVAAAPSEEAKKKVLDWEYSPTLHDPERIKSRAKKYGAHDVLYREDKPKSDDSWKQSPEVRSIIDDYKDWTERVKAHIKAAEAGKLSPEAHDFIARRAGKFAELVYDFVDMLEV